MKPGLLTSLCMVGLFAAQVRAQDPGVQLQLESTTLDVGEAVNGQLTCVNTGQPDPPQAAVPDGLDVQFSPTASQSSMMSIVNGRTTQRTTYTFPVRVVGKREGQFTLGPITVSADGTSFQANPVTITVRAAQPNAGETEGDKLIFVRLKVEPKSLYVTQSYDATLTIGIRKVEIDGQVREVRSLLQFVDARNSELAVFGPNFGQSPATLYDSSGKPHQYVLYSDNKIVRAEQVGETTVGPVFIKMDYPTALDRDIFGQTAISKRQKATARAEGIPLQVKGPPVESRPADFRAAIGKFTLSVSAKPTRVEQGKPVTLSVAIRGEPVEGVAGPDFAKQQELLSRFDFTGEEPAGDAENNQKVFRKAIFPKQVGEQTIPPLTWSFFDPSKETYVTLRSDPITIMVDPASPGSVSLAPRDVQPDAMHTTLTAIAGISPNYTDVDALLADSGRPISVPFLATALGVPPIACLALLLFSVRRERLRNDPRLARRREAMRRASSRIASAGAQSNPSLAVGELAEAMTGYLSDHFGLASGELTPAEVRDVLDRHGINGVLHQEIIGFLQSADAVRFAPGAMGDIEARQAAVKVRNWIRTIEKIT